MLQVAAVSGDLSTPLRVSARPTACLPGPKAASNDHASVSIGATPWDRLHQHALAALCLELSRAQIRLSRDPARVLTTADELSRAWPRRPEPMVLRARAHGQLGDYAKGWAAWQGALERGYDFRSAHALRDYALAAVFTDNGELALATYRRLITLTGAWADPRHRQRIYLEAAAAALRFGSGSPEEASGYLASARAAATSTGLRACLAGIEALVLHRRAGPMPDIERIDAAEVWHFVELVRREDLPSYWPVVPSHEALAAASLLVERYSLAEAAELWALYVQGMQSARPDPSALKLAIERQARLSAAGGTP